jgi:hypothetical protein
VTVRGAGAPQFMEKSNKLQGIVPDLSKPITQHNDEISASQSVRGAMSLLHRANRAENKRNLLSA